MILEPQNLQKGEVCNYRFTTSCGGIAFKPEEAFGTSLTAWNITFVEFEKEDKSYLGGAPSVKFDTGDNDYNKNMPTINQKFIYYYYEYEQMKELYFVVNEKDFHYHINLGRKGQYIVGRGGWKKYNNVFQADEGELSKFEDWKYDLECKPRFVFLTLTAL